MRKVNLLILAVAGAMAASTALAGSGSVTGSVYTAEELLSPCQESDNDARWGEAAETECEQYILGFVGALKASGAGKAAKICPPTVNTADEIRWAFMRWVHSDFSKRTAMPADAAMLETLKANYTCK